MVGRDRMGHRGSVDVAANEASLRPQRQHDEHSEYKRLAEQLRRPEWEQLRREWKWAVTEQSAHGQKTGGGGRPTGCCR